MRKSILIAATAAGLVATSCAGSQKKEDESVEEKKEAESAEEQKESAEEQKESAKSAKSADSEEPTPDVEADLPELEPLELREEAPKAEKVAQKDGVVEYEIGKLRLIHKTTPANSVVSTKLFVDGGVANLTDRIAGVEQLALNTAVNGGTESTPKDAFNSELDSMGSSISSFTGRDASGVSMRSIVKHFDPTWELFVEALLEPAMPAEEVQVQRDKQLASIQKISENPNKMVGHVARKLIARGHPYGRFQHGEPANLKAFNREHLLAYHRSLLEPSRLVLVVVGDVSRDEIVEKVRSSLGRLPEGDWQPPELGDFDVNGVRVDGEKKEIPTNYILGLFPTPPPGHADYPALKVALSHLSDRLFEAIRTKRNLSYAVSSGLSGHRTNNGYLYVSARSPNKTLDVMFDIVEKLKTEQLSEGQVQRTKNVFVTEHYMDQQTNASQADTLATAELLRGDWRKHAAYIDEIKAVTAADIQRVADKYLENYQFGVVGNPDAIDKSVIPSGD